jgi:crotonobetainyl-CoA hydratase
MALRENLPQSLVFSREVVADLAKTDDFKEGVNAFVEKRKPNWVNR